MTSPPAVGDQATAGWAALRPSASAGSITLTPATAGVQITASVVFPVGRFATPPIVVASLGNNAGVQCTVGVNAGVTATGCTVFLDAPNTTTRTINWIAIDPNY